MAQQSTLLLDGRNSHLQVHSQTGNHLCNKQYNSQINSTKIHLWESGISCMLRKKGRVFRQVFFPELFENVQVLFFPLQIWHGIKLRAVPALTGVFQWLFFQNPLFFSQLFSMLCLYRPEWDQNVSNTSPTIRTVKNFCSYNYLKVASIQGILRKTLSEAKGILWLWGKAAWFGNFY